MVKLGSFKDEIYDKFVDDDSECDFWTFAKKIAGANRDQIIPFHFQKM